MPDNPLLSLAAKIEAAEASEQRELLVAAFEAIHGEKPLRIAGGSADWADWLTLFNPFYRMLEAEAYLDAALSLVPENADWFLLQRLSRMGDGSRWQASVMLSDSGDNSGASAALAVCAAALRARSVQETNDGD